MGMMAASDSELLSRYRDGDVGALETLVERYRRPLFGYITRMVGPNGDADEVFQEVWFRVIHKVHRYRQKNFPGWLVRIAHNLVIDNARRKRPELVLDRENEAGTAMVARVAAEDRGPDREVQGWETGATIRKAVERLPPEQKEVFLMRVEAELPFKEIAKIQRVSINTALARMQYAVGKLRDALGPEYGSPA
jgi:RNA polymerase sigma-70 factor (ECF subfamily)